MLVWGILKSSIEKSLLRGHDDFEDSVGVGNVDESVSAEHEAQQEAVSAIIDDTR